MPVFKNLKDLENHMKKQYTAGKLKDNKGKTIQAISDDILRKEAQILQECIQRHIDYYYDSYQPSVYTRTNGLKEALEISTSIKIDSHGQRSIVLYFDENKDTGHSLFNGDTVSKAASVNFGWQVQSGWHKQIEHFGWQRPNNFIQKGIEDWKNISSYANLIDVQIREK